MSPATMKASPKDVGCMTAVPPGQAHTDTLLRGWRRVAGLLGTGFQTCWCG